MPMFPRVSHPLGNASLFSKQPALESTENKGGFTQPSHCPFLPNPLGRLTLIMALNVLLPFIVIQKSPPPRISSHASPHTLP